MQLNQKFLFIAALALGLLTPHYIMAVNQKKLLRSLSLGSCEKEAQAFQASFGTHDNVPQAPNSIGDNSMLISLVENNLSLHENLKLQQDEHQQLQDKHRQLEGGLSELKKVVANLSEVVYQDRLLQAQQKDKASRKYQEQKTQQVEETLSEQLEKNGILERLVAAQNDELAALSLQQNIASRKLRKEIKEKEQKLKENTKKISDLNFALIKADTAISEKNNEITELINDKKQELEKHTETTSRLDFVIFAGDHVLGEKEEEIAELTKKNALLQKEHQKMEQTIKEHTTEISDMKEKAQQSEKVLNLYKTKEDKTIKKMRDKTDENQLLEKKLKEKEAEISKLTGENMAYGTIKIINDKKLAELTKERDALKQRPQDLKNFLQGYLTKNSITSPSLVLDILNEFVEAFVNEHK